MPEGQGRSENCPHFLRSAAAHARTLRLLAALNFRSRPSRPFESNQRRLPRPDGLNYLLLVKRRPHTPNTISAALAIRHTLADSPKAAIPTKRLPVAPMPVHTA